MDVFPVGSYTQWAAKGELYCGSKLGLKEKKIGTTR